MAGGQQQRERFRPGDQKDVELVNRGQDGDPNALDRILREDEIIIIEKKPEGGYEATRVQMDRDARE